MMVSPAIGAFLVLVVQWQLWVQRDDACQMHGAGRLMHCCSCMPVPGAAMVVLGSDFCTILIQDRPIAAPLILGTGLQCALYTVWHHGRVA